MLPLANLFYEDVVEKVQLICSMRFSEHKSEWPPAIEAWRTHNRADLAELRSWREQLLKRLATLNPSEGIVTWAALEEARRLTISMGVMGFAMARDDQAANWCNPSRSEMLNDAGLAAAKRNAQEALLVANEALDRLASSSGKVAQ